MPEFKKKQFENYLAEKMMFRSLKDRIGLLQIELDSIKEQVDDQDRARPVVREYSCNNCECGKCNLRKEIMKHDRSKPTACLYEYGKSNWVLDSERNGYLY